MTIISNPIYASRWASSTGLDSRHRKKLKIVFPGASHHPIGKAMASCRSIEIRISVCRCSTLRPPTNHVQLNFLWKVGMYGAGVKIWVKAPKGYLTRSIMRGSHLRSWMEGTSDACSGTHLTQKKAPMISRMRVVATTHTEARRACCAKSNTLRRARELVDRARLPSPSWRAPAPRTWMNGSNDEC